MAKPRGRKGRPEDSPSVPFPTITIPQLPTTTTSPPPPTPPPSPSKTEDEWNFYNSFINNNKSTLAMPVQTEMASSSQGSSLKAMKRASSKVMDAHHEPPVEFDPFDASSRIPGSRIRQRLGSTSSIETIRSSSIPTKKKPVVEKKKDSRSSSVREIKPLPATGTNGRGRGFGGGHYDYDSSAIPCARDVDVHATGSAGNSSSAGCLELGSDEVSVTYATEQPAPAGLVGLGIQGIRQRVRVDGLGKSQIPLPVFHSRSAPLPPAITLSSPAPVPVPPPHRKDVPSTSTSILHPGPSRSTTAATHVAPPPPPPPPSHNHPTTYIGYNTKYHHPSTAATASQTDAYGCVHLGAADLNLFIVFPDSPHYEVWDLKDDEYAVCPAKLYLLVKDTHKWDHTPLSTPEISIIDIQCTARPIPTPTLTSTTAAGAGASLWQHDPDVGYTVKYMGSTTRDEKGLEIPTSNEGGITIDPRWVRTYAVPEVVVRKIREGREAEREAEGVRRRGRSSNGNGNGHSVKGMTPSSPSSSPSSPSSSSSSSSSSYSSSLDSGGRGWVLDFWIPIPTRLFLKKETRVFSVVANIWIEEEEQDELVDEDALVAVGEMTVSHLRKEREMWR